MVKQLFNNKNDSLRESDFTHVGQHCSWKCSYQTYLLRYLWFTHAFFLKKNIVQISLLLHSQFLVGLTTLLLLRATFFSGRNNNNVTSCRQRYLQHISRRLPDFIDLELTRNFRQRARESQFTRKLTFVIHMSSRFYSLKKIGNYIY